MSRGGLLDKLERRFGRFAVPNLTVYLLVGQMLCYLLIAMREDFVGALHLVPALVLSGEVWRVLTFAFMPPLLSPLLLFFAWYLFFLMGTALEHYWGAFRYNVFLLVGYVVTVLVSFATPLVPASNAFIGTSVFLAFAYLYPNFVLHLFFILPVKIKWLAAITWLMYGVNIVAGDNQMRLLIVASAANFVLFFGKDILWRAKMAHRKASTELEKEAQKAEPLHTCSECGTTDLDKTDMDFRYCTKCEPVQCFCSEHIGAHKHMLKPETANPE